MKTDWGTSRDSSFCCFLWAVLCESVCVAFVRLLLFSALANDEEKTVAFFRWLMMMVFVLFEKHFENERGVTAHDEQTSFDRSIRALSQQWPSGTSDLAHAVTAKSSLKGWLTPRRPSGVSYYHMKHILRILVASCPCKFFSPTLKHPPLTALSETLSEPWVQFTCPIASKLVWCMLGTSWTSSHGWTRDWLNHIDLESTASHSSGLWWF